MSEIVKATVFRVNKERIEYFRMLAKGLMTITKDETTFSRFANSASRWDLPEIEGILKEKTNLNWDELKAMVIAITSTYRAKVLMGAVNFPTTN